MFDFIFDLSYPLLFICFFLFIILGKFFKRVPANTVYIIDRNTHYLKTVQKGFFLFNPSTDKITTKISTVPITMRYFDIFETEDGAFLNVSFDVTYHVRNIEDTLYNLEKVRRSIDDIIKSCMYFAMLTLNSKFISMMLVEKAFKRNLEGQAMQVGIDINSFHINNLVYTTNRQAFKPHKNYSDSKDPIQYV